MSDELTQASAPESPATPPVEAPPVEAAPSNGTATPAVDTSAMSMDDLIEAMSVPDHDPFENELIEDAVESANSLEEFQEMLGSDKGQEALQQPHAPLPVETPSAPEAEEPSILEQDPLAAAAAAPPAPAPVVDPAMQTLLQQNQQLIQQLATQNQPQQTGPTDAQVAQEIERLGGDPTDPFHVAYYTDRITANQREQGLAQQVQQMRQEMQHLAVQAQSIRARSAVAPQVQQALKPYGNVPAETADAISGGAAQLVQAGHDPVSAIRAAAGPFLPLLRALKAQPRQPAPRAPVANRAAMNAAALPGSGTGTKKISEVPMSDLLNTMFS